MTDVFIPSAYLLGTKRRPESLVIYSVTGGAEKWLRIPLDTSRPPVTFAAQALKVARQTPRVPFHGDITGFVINFCPDRAVVYDDAGNPIEELTEPYAPGRVHVQIGNRKSSVLALKRCLGVDT